MTLDSHQFPFSLGSDNHAAVHPKILQAILAVNQGFAPSYGTDSVTTATKALFQKEFGSDQVYFCFNGTAANVLSIGSLLDRHEGVLCSEQSHIMVDEGGAPESILGTKLTPIKSIKGDAKLSPDLIAPYLIRRGDQHFHQPKLMSITQPTEVGTLYSKEELQSLRLFCNENDLWLHIDGARLVNAAVQLGGLKEACKGADVVSFGGTKNGLLFGEAVIFLTEKAREKAKNFSYFRKQLMQLPSKTRYLSAQFHAFLQNNLWYEIASHSLQMALLLREGLENAIKNGAAITFTQPTQSNAVFAIFDRDTEKSLKQTAFFYIWDEHTREARLMTAWNTDPKDIEWFLKKLPPFS